MSNLEEIVRKFALKNAAEHGSAQVNAVVGKVLAEFPEAKKDMKECMGLISRITKEVNSLGKEAVQKELSKYTFNEVKKEERGLSIENAQVGNVITRFPPEPSGYPHIGHAKAIFLDYEIAKLYNGKFYLRFDDTNPEKESLAYANAIKEGVSWLGVKWDKEEFASDSLPLLYKYAEHLITKGDLYVCFCRQEQIKDNRAMQKECDCRKKSTSANLEAWNGLLNRLIHEGEAIVRLKGDMHSLNTVLRDPTMLRIITAPHYRQGSKYAVWPSYDFEAPILDSVSGITHAMRTKEYELRDELYNMLLGKLGLRKPQLIEFSRLNIKNMPISKRLLSPLVANKTVIGWDDPRLPTLAGLKRRGITPEAIKKFVLSFGLGKAESEPTIDALLTENRKLLDPTTPRYFFVHNPVILTVTNAPPMTAQLKKHPSNDLGHRNVNTNDTFYISQKDSQELKDGELIRLKELYNVKILKKGPNGISAEYAGRELIQNKKIQWVSDKYLECEVLVPLDLFDGEKLVENSLRSDNGYCESGCADLKEGDVVQFERYGFARLDTKKPLKFIFSHS